MSGIGFRPGYCQGLLFDLFQWGNINRPWHRSLLRGRKWLGWGEETRVVEVGKVT